MKKLYAVIEEALLPLSLSRKKLGAWSVQERDPGQVLITCAPPSRVVALRYLKHLGAKVVENVG